MNGTMTDVELAALTTLVAHETACMNADVKKYGEALCDPRSPAVRNLEAELKLRGVLPSERL